MGRPQDNVNRSISVGFSTSFLSLLLFSIISLPSTIASPLWPRDNSNTSTSANANTTASSNSTSLGYTPKLVVYHQTIYPNSDAGPYVSPLPLINSNPPLIPTALNIAAFHLNNASLYDPTIAPLTLNDWAINATQYDQLWADLSVMRSAGVKIIAMLGGSYAGSYSTATLASNDTATYAYWYDILCNGLREYGFDGIDLDIEQDMTLDAVEQLVTDLKRDFGEGFTVTMAPVAAAMTELSGGLSGFDYLLFEKQMPSGVDWYNVQFYNGWGDPSTPLGYAKMIAYGWDPKKIVMTVLTNPDDGYADYDSVDDLATTVDTLMNKFPTFGGVAGWEYFNSDPGDLAAPWVWADEMGAVLTGTWAGTES